MSEQGGRESEHGSVGREGQGGARRGEPSGRPGGAAPGGAALGDGALGGAAPGGAAPGGSRGQRLGLPAGGPGSLAGAGRRIAAFTIDAVLCTLVAGLFTAPELPRLWSLLAFFCEYVFFSATFGQTPGMALLRLGLVRVNGSGRVGIGRAGLRTVLLMVLVPAVIFDSDGRGMHDRLTGTAVVRMR